MFPTVISCVCLLCYSGASVDWCMLGWALEGSNVRYHVLILLHPVSWFVLGNTVMKQTEPSVFFI